MTLAAAAYQGGLLLSQGEQRRAHFDDFRRRLEFCAQFGIPTLLVVADFVEAVDRTALERAVVSLAEAGQTAAGFGVRAGPGIPQQGRLLFQPGHRRRPGRPTAASRTSASASMPSTTAPARASRKTWTC